MTDPAPDDRAARIVEHFREKPEEFARLMLGIETLWGRQIEIMRAVRDHPHVAVQSCHGVGKAVRIDTPLPTPTGWTTMGDVQIGDELYDETGAACSVVAMSPITNRPSSRVLFSDGSEIIASDDHLWTVLDLSSKLRHVPTNDWRERWGEGRTLTTAELAAEPTYAGQRRWRVPTCEALTGETPWDWPFDPYTFGHWLGNGTTICAELTCHSQDAEFVAAAVGATSVTYYDDRLAARVRLSARPFVDCPGRLTGGKRIPAAMLRASREDRLEVLRGLMDSDGYNSHSAGAELTLCNEALFGDVVELVTSLGWIIRTASRPAKIYGRVVGTRYVLNFRPSICPFRLPRKADRWTAQLGSAQGSRHTIRTIVSIEPCGEQPVKCVTVDSPRNLYLAGRSMIPTHNSFVTSVVTWWWKFCFRPSKVIVTAPGGRQAEKVLGAEIRARHAALRARFPKDELEAIGLGGEPTTQGWESDPSNFILWFATRADDAKEHATRATGWHSPHLLLIFEEAGGIAKPIWDAVEGNRTDAGTHFLCIGNPTDPTSQFAAFCRAPTTHTIRIDAFDFPNVVEGRQVLPYGPTRAWCDEMARKWGATSGTFAWKVRGQFPTVATDTLIGYAEVQAALERVAAPCKHPPEALGIGCDVARFGDDRTVVYVVCSACKAAIDVEERHGQDTVATVGIALHMAKRHGLPAAGADRIAVDDTGVGGGVTDGLRAKGWHVQAVNFGSGATEEETFTNRRTELWWGLREWLRGGASLAGLAREVRDGLLDELTAPKYQTRPDGRIALEPKDRIKERVGRSPDHGDALALAVAGTVASGGVVAAMGSVLHRLAARSATNRIGDPDPPHGLRGDRKTARDQYDAAFGTGGSEPW